jgi:hypothetical protein
MIKQIFALNNSIKSELYVVKQRSIKLESISIQISAIVDLEHNPLDWDRDSITLPLRYIYEEINNDDEVIYARYMGQDNIARCYPWFFDAVKVDSDKEV